MCILLSLEDKGSLRFWLTCASLTTFSFSERQLVTNSTKGKSDQITWPRIILKMSTFYDNTCFLSTGFSEHQNPVNSTQTNTHFIHMLILDNNIKPHASCVSACMLVNSDTALSIAHSVLLVGRELPHEKDKCLHRACVFAACERFAATATLQR